MTRPFVITAALATFALTSAADAQQANWRTIAYKTVSGGTDRDTINVRGDTRYCQVRLCSINRPIRMIDFDVYFDNGGHQDVPVRQRISAGQCTRNIDLTGKRRDINRVQLAYERLQRSRQLPLIQVQAR